MNKNWFSEKSLWSRFRNAYIKNVNFKSFWIEMNKKKIDKDLIEVIDFFINSKSYNSVSRIWHINNIRHINQINEIGIESFASTVALDYFTFTDFDDQIIKNLITKFDKDNKISSITNIDIFKKYKNLGYSHSINHNIVLNLLYSYLKYYGDVALLEIYRNNNYLIDQSTYIEIDNIKINHDRINSALEYVKIENILDKYEDNINIVEIGAGAGRLTETILAHQKKKIKYFVVDIPPALYINFLRVKKNFSNKKIGIALNINTVSELMNYCKDKDILFLMPHQLEMLKDININLFVAIDCLHEMDKKSIKYYMDNIDRLGEYFYFKVLNETYVPYSFKNYLSASDKKSYYIRQNWNEIFKDECVFPSNYFEFAYKIK